MSDSNSSLLKISPYLVCGISYGFLIIILDLTLLILGGDNLLSQIAMLGNRFVMSYFLILILPIFSLIISIFSGLIRDFNSKNRNFSAFMEGASGSFFVLVIFSICSTFSASIIVSDIDTVDSDSYLLGTDYDGDGVHEVYWKTNDGTAYLRALMHADGNIRYANYQNEQQMTQYLTDNGFDESTISEIIA